MANDLNGLMFQKKKKKKRSNGTFMGLFIGIYYDCVLVWSIKYIIMVIYQ